MKLFWSKKLFGGFRIGGKIGGNKSSDDKKSSGGGIGCGTVALVLLGVVLIYGILSAIFGWDDDPTATATATATATEPGRAVIVTPTTEPEPTAEPEPTTQPEPTTEPEPTAEPTAEPEPTTQPEPTTPPKPTYEGLKIVSLTSPAHPGEMATLTAKGKPNTQYIISVYYSSGASKAQGLEKHTSDADGNVSWTWKVGINTDPGSYRIVVTDGDEKVEIYLTVTE